jgi:peptide/nickel transport system substrate-binding protein
MKLFGLKFLVASSLLLTGWAAAGTRPNYGGTLRVMTRIAPTSLDPLHQTQAESLVQQNLSQLLFDNLVVLDGVGRMNPGLALSWKSDAGNQRWTFALRHGVTFDDGTPLTATLVAGSLRSANPDWNVYVVDDSISIALQAPDPSFPATLSLPRNAIVRRTADRISGTGPFRVSEFRAGKELLVIANEEHWAGRPIY